MEGGTKNKGHSFGTLITLLIVGVVAGSIGFFEWKVYQTGNVIELAKEGIPKIEESLQGLSGGVSFSEFLKSFEAVENAQEYRVEWSKVAAFVFAFETEEVQFQQFSSAEAEQISITGTSRTMKGVQDLLKKLEQQKEKVQNVFLSSLQKKSGSTGEFGYTFTLTFNFQSS